ncbi:MAG: hypothetical protein ACTSRF_16465 [Candidatus Freyarchaeota archaeon]
MEIEFRTVVRNRVEYRFDPLTGEQCRINPERAKRVKQAEIDVEFSDIIHRSRENCPFCPENIYEKTPQFPRELCEEGRIRVGESVIFPNLNPFGENHAVGTITHAHFLDLDEFETRMIRDNLTASREYASAGSIIHPHVQIMVEREPTPQQRRLLEKSKQYFQENGTNYWKDLIEKEKRNGERFIGETGSVSVTASFAPRGFNEVQFTFHEVGSLAELGKREINDFADCLLRVLRGYKKIGVGSFNLASYSYTNDTGPMERLYDVWVIDTLPETLAGMLRGFFG